MRLEELFKTHMAILEALPKGPHLLVANDGETAWCGGQGVCKACIENWGVSILEAMAWKELTGWMAGKAFGKHNSAHCSQATYDELRTHCTVGVGQSLLLYAPLNGFSVHVKEGVLDGVLQRCDCLPIVDDRNNNPDYAAWKDI